MSVRIRLAASILAADFANLGAAIAQAEAGGTDWIHVDVMDGHFVPNLTMGPAIVEACRRVSELPLDVHLMVETPERFIPDFARAGASNLTVHVEATPHLHRTVQLIKELGLTAGVALNPATPALAVSEILPDVDLILAMTVNPGYSGQRFIDRVLPKVRALRAMAAERGLDTDIEVDGGVDTQTGPKAARAGATVFVAATAVYRHGESISEAAAALKRSIAQAVGA